MKLLFCGLGSIGQKHIRNVASILRRRDIEFTMDAVRTTCRPLPADSQALLANSYASIADAPNDYDAAFVTNPTALHRETIAALVPKANTIYIEKPVFDTAEIDLASLGLRDTGVYYVACPLRRHPVICRLKEIIAATPVIAARAICSSYLPDWRVGDYRQSYSAHRAQGGGVSLDLIHEWDYLVDLFGFPREVRRFAAHLSPLEIDSDDVAVYIAQYDSMLLSLQLDYIGRAPKREIALYTNDDVIVGDMLASTVTWQRADVIETLPPADIHALDVGYFLECALSGKADNDNTIPHALSVLRAALGGKQ